MKNIEYVEVCQIVNYWNINSEIEENVNQVYKADILIQTKDFKTISSPVTAQAYIKFIPPRKIYSEVICALIGRSIGLNIPKPMVGLLKPGKEIPEDLSDDYDKYSPIFASMDATFPSVRNRVKNQDNKIEDALYNHFIDKITRWKKLLEASCFDEFFCNNDRHIGNLLHDGIANEFWLIDHERANPPILNSNCLNIDNKLINLNCDNDIGRQKLSKASSKLATPYFDFDSQQILEKTAHQHYTTNHNEITQNARELYNRTQNLIGLLNQHAMSNQTQGQLSYHGTE